MSSRYRPNEADCPVPLALLSLLLRVNEDETARQLCQLPEHQRVELAFFCFARAHMRALGVRIAALCSEDALTRSTGMLGASLLEQSRNQAEHTGKTESSYKRSVTLARRA